MSTRHHTDRRQPVISRNPCQTTHPDQDERAQCERLRSKVREVARKQDNILRQAEDTDPSDPFAQGLRQRFNDLTAERDNLNAALAQLDQEAKKEHVESRVDQAALLDALPYLAINLTRAPRELLDRLFDLTQLTVQVHYATNEATLRVTLPADSLDTLAELGGESAGKCEGSPGQGLCASCSCPR